MDNPTDNFEYAPLQRRSLHQTLAQAALQDTCLPTVPKLLDRYLEYILLSDQDELTFE